MPLQRRFTTRLQISDDLQSPGSGHQQAAVARSLWASLSSQLSSGKFMKVVIRPGAADALGVTIPLTLPACWVVMRRPRRPVPGSLDTSLCRLLQIGYQVRSVGRIGQTGVGHAVADNDLLRISNEFVESFCRPSDAAAFHGC